MRKRTPLKRAIFERELVQKDVARELGINESAFSRIVGGAPCSDELARRIAVAVDVPVDELFPAYAVH